MRFGLVRGERDDVNRTDTLYTSFIGGVSSLFAYLVGGIDHLFEAFVTFMIFDYVTGVLAGWYLKKLSSRQSLWGIVRKCLMFVLVIVAHELDTVAGNEGSFMRNAMLMFLVATEGISIFENLGKLGLKYPSFIMTALIKLRGDNGQRRRKDD